MHSKQTKSFKKDNLSMLIANPISSDLDEMRPSLLPNLITAVGKNQTRGNGNVALFELGPEFFGTKPGEQRNVACGVRAGEIGERHWLEKARPVDVFDAKADAIDALRAIKAPAENAQITNDAPDYYHPGRSGTIRLGKNVLAYFGEIHPAILNEFSIKGTVVGFEVYTDNAPIKKDKSKSKTKAIFNPSQLQNVNRDFAFVVDSKIPANDVIRSAIAADKKLISDVKVFDLYEGEHLEKGKKSLAIQVTLEPKDKTLTDQEIEEVSLRIISQVKNKTGAILRS